MDVHRKLCEAASVNDLELLQTLQRNGVDLNVGDNLGRTAIHLAASNGCIEALNWLASQADVDVNVMDRYGNTPLDDAVKHEQEAVQASFPFLCARFFTSSCAPSSATKQ